MVELFPKAQRPAFQQKEGLLCHLNPMDGDRFGLELRQHGQNQELGDSETGRG